jgi:membrane protease YdiL (CAAX protease family)
MSNEPVHELHHEHLAETAWHRFWNRGGWWKALGVAVVYLALYEGFSLLIGLVFGDQIDVQNILATPQSVFFGLGVSILFGGLVLLLFVWSLGWLREVFGRQPIRGRWWMWIAVALVVIPILLRVFATNWGAYAAGVVPTMLLTGVFIGFAEELLTRGIAVNLLRRGGYGERAVMLLSSLLFALLHSVNAFTQPPLTVALTVAYTFGFGVMMYLVLRATGSIIWPMLLHAATDPTTFLATGGLDAAGATSGSEGLISIAGIFNFVYIGVAVIAIFLVKGKVYPDRSPLTRGAR